ncbi:hypothetical protein AYO41_02435 [Verrucomicrobia bacterium SCGC AG-212-E04]|nr:hypothetical protein AYO41_02435 [Verrucomicrobia bacterium SCGC AG-212-E04]
MLVPLFCAALAGCGGRSTEKSVLQVEVQRVEPTDAAKTLTLTGEIRAQVESALSFRATGRITERLVDVGDHVSAGQILATLDSYQQQSTVDAAEADVRDADAKFRNAASAFERQKYLLSRKSTPQSEYDRAEGSFRTAQSSLDAAKAQLGMARDALAQTILRADHAGTITGRKAEMGQVVAEGQSVFVLAHDGPRDAVFNVNDSVFGSQPVDRNIQVQINLVSNPSIHTTGNVREVTPTLSGAGGTVAIKVGLDEAPAGITLGAAVVGEALSGSQEVITLPASSLGSVAGQPSVWIVDPATSTVTAKAITVARYETNRVIVAAGLRPGDIVVTRGTQQMTPKLKVTITEEH